MNHIVKSSDGVSFLVGSDRRTVPYDIAFAAAKSAAELETNEDFLRVEGPLSDADTTYSSDMLSSEEIFPARETDGEVEALRRATTRWGTAAYILGDKS